MDEQKKQKVLIGVLAVLIIGAGTYFVAFRDSGSGAQQMASQANVERKTREGMQRPSDRQTRAKREVVRPVAEEQTVERKERDERDARSTTGRKSRRLDVKEEKKKKLSPAA